MAYFKIENLSIHFYTVPASSFVQISVKKNENDGIQEMGFLCPNKEIESGIHQWKMKTPFGYLLTTQPFEYFKDCFMIWVQQIAKQQQNNVSNNVLILRVNVFMAFLLVKIIMLLMDNR